MYLLGHKVQEKHNFLILKELFPNLNIVLLLGRKATLILLSTFSGELQEGSKGFHSDFKRLYGVSRWVRISWGIGYSIHLGEPQRGFRELTGVSGRFTGFQKGSQGLWRALHGFR